MLPLGLAAATTTTATTTTTVADIVVVVVVVVVIHTLSKLVRCSIDTMYKIKTFFMGNVSQM